MKEWQTACNRRGHGACCRTPLPPKGGPVAFYATAGARERCRQTPTGDTEGVSERNVLGGPLEPCGMDAVIAATDTDAAGEAMAHDGLLPETLVILVEA